MHHRMNQDTIRPRPFLAIIVMSLLGHASAQRMMEKLNRGLIAVSADGGAYLSWRLFGTEPSNLGFNVYKGATKLNDQPLTGATLFADKTSGPGTYTVRPVINGQEGAASEPARVLSQNYHAVNLQTPPAGSGYTYTANDASVGDLDGDGEYEIILKWEPSNARDNSQDGMTGNVLIDAYQMDGKRLWRIDLGRNIRAGAHYTQFMVADFDGDGKAEMICKTADGTIDGAGKLIGNASADFRNSRGYIMTGPEFMTIFEGTTGKAMQTVDYNPPRGEVCAWGDPDCATYANRVDRFLAAVAYLDGVLPSAVMCRGYYTRSVLAAWDWRGGKLTQRWVFDTAVPGTPPGYTGQGAHSLSVADVDQDGMDEIIYGAAAIDHDGKALWTTRLGHGDALHVSDFDPARPGLEVYMIHEGGTQPGADLRNARTGEVYWKTTPQDVGRGVAADILESNAGAEFWGPSGGVRNAMGQTVTVGTGSQNFLGWWDGDLLRELVDGTRVHKAGGATLLSAEGCASNNSTKSTPSLTADLFGDWREEVMWRTSDNRQLRIYTTTTPTTHRLYTLMHNPAYRAAVAWQNVAYNQPPHVDYYLGTGMTFPPPKPNIVVGGVTSISRLKAGRAPKAGGRVVNYAGEKRIALPLGFTGGNQVVLMRDSFGRVVARGIPVKGYLNLPYGLPRGLYNLQAGGLP
jgi:rhamnogalacturonan endolyase